MQLLILVSCENVNAKLAAVKINTAYKIMC